MNESFCPICHQPEAHKGSRDIKVCETCQGELLKQLEDEMPVQN